MSVAKRRIDIDPQTSVQEAFDQLTDPGDEIELRVGSHLYVVHRREATVSDAIEQKPSLMERLRPYIGSMGDLIDADELTTYVYEERDRGTQGDRPSAVLP